MPRNAKRRRDRRTRYQPPAPTTQAEPITHPWPANALCPACGAPPEGALLSEEVEVAELEATAEGGLRFRGDVMYGEREPRSEEGGLLLLCSSCGAEYPASAITGEQPQGA